MIVIPAAGEGRRFREAGYQQPKHLIPLGGIPMIDRVIANVRAIAPADDVLVVTQDLVGKTRGTAETLARATVPDGEPLIVANCDQLLDFPADWQRPMADAVIFTFQSAEPAHSYVKTREDGLVWRIREKEVISSQAVAGVYWFRDARPILSQCRYLCEHGGAGGELYLSAALRRMVALDYRVYAVDAPTAILGTPEDFARFSVALSMAAA